MACRRCVCLPLCCLSAGSPLTIVAPPLPDARPVPLSSAPRLAGARRCFVHNIDSVNSALLTQLQRADNENNTPLSAGQSMPYSAGGPPGSRRSCGLLQRPCCRGTEHTECCVRTTLRRIALHGAPAGCAFRAMTPVCQSSEVMAVIDGGRCSHRSNLIGSAAFLLTSGKLLTPYIKWSPRAGMVIYQKFICGNRPGGVAFHINFGMLQATDDAYKSTEGYWACSYLILQNRTSHTSCAHVPSDKSPMTQHWCYLSCFWHFWLSWGR